MISMAPGIDVFRWYVYKIEKTRQYRVQDKVFTKKQTSTKRTSALVKKLQGRLTKKNLIPVKKLSRDLRKSFEMIWV